MVAHNGNRTPRPLFSSDRSCLRLAVGAGMVFQGPRRRWSYIILMVRRFLVLKSALSSRRGVGESDFEVYCN